MLNLALLLALTSAAAAPPQEAPAPGTEQKLPTLESTFEHDLATPEGVVNITWPSIAYDRAQDEIFMAAEGWVRIFDKTGMEVHRFGDDGSLGNISRVAVMEDGQIVVLTSRDGKKEYVRCDFRGDPLEKFELTGLPRAFADFDPDQLVYHDGRLYFAERGSMRVVVTDVMGGYRQSYNLRNIVAAALASAGDTERKPPGAMDGFSVDRKGNILFTMSTMFQGAVFSPNGKLRLFGSRGSTPGKFNIIGGIDSDEEGNVYVTDRLRSVVSVWTADLRHLGDFGYRGGERWNLLTPFEIGVGNGRVFVAQAGNRGVKVFRVKIVPPPEPAAAEPQAQAQ